jgi:hypothetical protein
MILTKNGKMHNQISLKKFKAFVKLYNSLVQKGYKNAELTEFIKETLNHKNVTTFVAADEGKALQNRMITQIRNNLSDIRNVVPTYSPISVGDRSSGPKGLKMNSEKYIGSQLGHPDVPLKRIADVSNQSSGKSVVGIMAAGLKLYATISYVVEDMLYKN